MVSQQASEADRRKAALKAEAFIQKKLEECGLPPPPNPSVPPRTELPPGLLNDPKYPHFPESFPQKDREDFYYVQRFLNEYSFWAGGVGHLRAQFLRLDPHVPPIEDWESFPSAAWDGLLIENPADLGLSFTARPRLQVLKKWFDGRLPLSGPLSFDEMMKYRVWNDEWENWQKCPPMPDPNYDRKAAFVDSAMQERTHVVAAASLLAQFLHNGEIGEGPNRTTTTYTKMTGGKFYRSWPEIHFRFCNGETVSLQEPSGGWRDVNFTMIGAIDRRSKKPNRVWDDLRALAEGNGKISLSRERKSNLAKTLKMFFGIATDPFESLHKDQGATTYRAFFNVEPET